MGSPLLHGEEKPLLTNSEEGVAGGAGRGEKRSVSVCTQQPEKGVLLLKLAGGKGQAPLCCWAVAARWAGGLRLGPGSQPVMQVMAQHWTSWGQGPRTLSDILNGRTSDPRQKGRAGTGSGDAGRAGRAPSSAEALR